MSSIIPATTQRPATNDTQAVNAAPAAGAVSSDNVHLTQGAAELQALEKAVSEAPDFDVERVNRIRQAIAEGTYQIDGQKLAESLLRFETQMASGGPRKR
ncbi:MAG: flagellar biosynthesis anti-sigma factor FlgM [Chromatiales bacterium]